MKVKDYKPQIDGLRALAVIPVIFFHAGLNTFQGGFVGVDVFFVISGYLITKIIIEDISRKKFSLQNFYIRRARRLLPVLYSIIILSMPFAVFLMGDEQLIFFSKQIFSVIFFISNFFFWKNSGYFDPSSELQPLLHTWSLAVEEQFYIVFPILIIFIYKYFKNKIIFFLLIITLISLFLSQLGGNFKIENLSNSYPFFLLPFEFFWQAGSANFYLPFGRIWELIFGSMIAVGLSKKKEKKGRYNNIFSILGFILILFSIFFYSENMQYPSIFTLIPCLGTSLIILYTDKKTLLFKILTFKPIIFLGLISYSLYLWHQPIFAFNKIYFGADLSFFHIIFLVSLSFILSLFSWKLIEQPFRDRKKVSNKNFINFLLSITIIIIFFCSLIFLEKINSLKKKLPETVKQTIATLDNNSCFGLQKSHLKKTNKWYCEAGNKTSNISFVVVGDSHASASIPGFNLAAIKKRKKGIITGYAGCPGFLGVQSIRPNIKSHNCKLLSEKVYDFIKENKIKKLYLVGRWNYYTGDSYNRREFQPITTTDNFFSNVSNSKKAFLNGLENTINAYQSIGVDLVFVHQVPTQLYDPKFVYLNSYNFTERKLDLNKLNEFSVDFNKNLDSQKFIRENINILKKKGYKFKVIDLNDVICDKNKCYIGDKDSSYYADNDHLSFEGAKLLQNKILETLE
tara:strand:+ start:687 stop:2735 length:2049 start_codon:yes stop_codon:yes gene_type:complete